MQKLFYNLRDSGSADGDALRDALVAKVVPAIRACGGREVVVFAADRAVAAGKPVRQIDPPIRAMVSFWLEDAADRGPAEAAMRGVARGVDGWLVVESRPVAHTMTAGRRTPGMKQISCVTKRADLSQDEFIRIWHTDHRQVAIETQSTFGYVRNELFRALTPNAPTQWTAIVEESFPIEALDDPHVFYDAKSEAEYQKNFARMMESCGRFLDHRPIEVTFVSEYYQG